PIAYFEWTIEVNHQTTEEVRQQIFCSKTYD
ncbi:hypothetical protein D039_1127B, partial [Vibrio parahaemolyticus EKP-028]